MCKTSVNKKFNVFYRYSSATESYVTFKDPIDYISTNAKVSEEN